ncbi:MAG: ABC transporter ATP-binding protein [Candidatus Margulisiibacteriota bacterium]|nr:MAG: ABC transporter [Candidatus Margulisbacteria bacterium GWD2_39_127]OGI01640.1 MAG: ABC transporter [Candidatus Margulisbacteria bacterium GWF2_38_17]OGI06898.1 MAG: ABC transporter [Candidatus Margulisbacteria bacterium GWE2_39_32]PZM83874.1 MAG: ABC transporter ATP-binding protein [Candidatus Margulisiibacteriota bacterium]HAR63603.1 ABC transporter ATP-binding protein [Candidatus Margulisiibacteriota bacterium]
MKKNIISVTNVKKSFGTFIALNNVSFEVQEGECFSLLGPNGAGKTTMMKMIYGRSIRDKHDHGNISVFGCDPAMNELEIKYLSGIVQQENNVDEELNVKENLDIYARFYAIPAKSAQERISSQLDFMELSDKKYAHVKELSGGMKRRLVIARALLNNPKLLILDEPTAGLDPQVRHLIWDKIRYLKKEGTTVLLTTHYMEEAFQLADNIMILYQGEKVAGGNPKELLKHTIESYVLEVQDKSELSHIKQLLSTMSARLDEARDILFIFSDTIDDLKKFSTILKPGTFLLRQTNLEDLFLKLTGRKLHEER